MPLSLARIRTRAAAIALGLVLLAPAGAQAQWRVAAPLETSGTALPLFQPQAPLTPSERLAQAGPLYGTSTDLQLIAFGAALLYGGYRLKEADHPYLGATVGLFGLVSFVFGFTDLIDPHRYPAPAPRDTARTERGVKE